MKRLYTKLVEYSKQDVYPMHMPGHKRNKKIIKMEDPYSIDITEIDDFDDMHHARGIIKNITDRANNIYKTNYTYISVNGSSIGIMSAISACTNIGDKIIMARNCHKSVYNTVYIRKLEPVYVYPRILENNINGEITVEQIHKLVENEDKIKCVVITSPTYEGIMSDVKKISNYLHTKKIPLIVDSAHGAHIGIFNNGKNATTEGADIVIHSIHKTLPAFTQTALVNVNNFGIIDNNKVKKYMSIYQSSSPSYILMSGIDKCLDIVEKKGQKMYDKLKESLEDFYNEMNNLKNIKIFHYKNMDITKIVILGNGNFIYNILREKYKIQLEMKCYNYALAMTSICDTKEGIQRLKNALKEIDTMPNAVFNNQNYIENIKGIDGVKRWCLPCEVENFQIQSVKFEDTKGMASAGYVYLYPPDIPLIVPGEIISEEQIECIKIYKKSGLCVEGTEDFKVIRKGMR